MSWRLRLAIIAVVIVVTWVVIAPRIAGSLELRKPLEKAEAIYVLGGSSALEERIATAAELYEQGVSKRILLTDDGNRAGWSTSKQTNPRFVDIAAELLVKKGVDTNDVHVIEAVVNGTYEEAEVVSGFVNREKIDSLLLVTSRYHTSRAYRAFEQRIPSKTIGVVGSREGKHSPSKRTWWLSIRGLKTIGGETLKSLVYYFYF